MRGLIITLTLSILLLIWQIISFQTIKAQSNTTPIPPPSEASSTGSPENEPQIISPRPGEALQGSVPVVVDTTLLDFQSVELTFGYANDPNKTWFLIHQGVRPVTGTMLVLWETSTLTDGEYTLRMVVTFQDGSQKTVLIPEIRVRNYSPLETNTPLPIQPSPTQAPSTTATPSLIPTSTVLAVATSSPLHSTSNPIEILHSDVLNSAAKGALLIIGLFALGGIYYILRTGGRKI